MLGTPGQCVRSRHTSSPRSVAVSLPWVYVFSNIAPARLRSRRPGAIRISAFQTVLNVSALPRWVTTGRSSSRSRPAAVAIASYTVSTSSHANHAPETSASSSSRMGRGRPAMARSTMSSPSSARKASRCRSTSVADIFTTTPGCTRRWANGSCMSRSSLTAVEDQPSGLGLMIPVPVPPMYA